MSNEFVDLLTYMTEAISSTGNSNLLFNQLTSKLRMIFTFDIAVISAIEHDKKNDVITRRKLFVNDFEAELTETKQYAKTSGASLIINGTIVEEIYRKKEIVIIRLDELTNEQLHGYYPFVMLKEGGSKQIVISPLVYGGELVGILSLVSRAYVDYSEKDIKLLKFLSRNIAISVSHALDFENIINSEKERTLQLAVNNALVTIHDRNEMFLQVATEINKVIPNVFFGLRIQHKDGKIEAISNLTKNQSGVFSDVNYGKMEYQKMFEKLNSLPGERVSEAKLFVGESFMERYKTSEMTRLIHDSYGINSTMVVPFEVNSDISAFIVLAEQKQNAFNEDALEIMKNLVSQISLALKNMFAFEEIDRLKKQLEMEKTYLMDEIKSTSNFEEIIGTSPQLQFSLRMIEQVASTSASVLIQGETGTGKELIARALHEASNRKNKPMIKINCAALPANLIESELFGHEKGSFTGAFEKRIGKFELAEGGTIFLDEIGEMPLDLQSKLLRVLQEKEYERIGGTKVMKSDVRVIAATNRDLKQEVEKGNFRSDLFYRLNVFPILVPPLRERKEDIPVLVAYFIRKLSKRHGKMLKMIRESDMKLLLDYQWPGNIRELEHMVEQSMIVSSGNFLTLPVLNGTSISQDFKGEIISLKEMEKDHILKTLQFTNGKISGKNGAAEILKINAKTLEARMKKLGIRREIKITSGT